MARDIDPKAVTAMIAKIIISLFILRILLKVAGYHGYIPIADEIYNVIMSIFYAIGGNSPSMSKPF